MLTAISEQRDHKKIRLVADEFHFLPRKLEMMEMNMTTVEEDDHRKELQRLRGARRRTVEAKSILLHSLFECPKDAPFIASYMPNRSVNFFEVNALLFVQFRQEGTFDTKLPNPYSIEDVSHFSFAFFVIVIK